MTGFRFCTEKNKSGNIIKDQSNSRVKIDCDVHIQFPRD